MKSIEVDGTVHYSKHVDQSSKQASSITPCGSEVPDTYAMNSGISC